jgi:hypothetical protein
MSIMDTMSNAGNIILLWSEWEPSLCVNNNCHMILRFHQKKFYRVNT